MKLNYISILISCFTILSCGNSYKPQNNSGSEPEKKEVKKMVEDYDFEQVGYYKQNKLRYMTFYVEGSVNDSITDFLLKEVKKHGSKQSNTSGYATASFYYFHKSDTPDITLANNSQVANDTAHNAKPFASVWIMPNGQVNLIEKPE